MGSQGPDAIVLWMLEQIARQGQLHQEDAADEIVKVFGSDFVYENEHGRKAIDKRIVKAFRKAAGHRVVWDREQFLWRKRLSADWRKDKR
jgi:hypothetical protein